MKTVRYAVLLAATAGCLVMPLSRSPIYAASEPAAPPAAAAASSPSGAQVYADHCSICHGDKLQGNLPAFPPLLGVSHRYNAAQITGQIHKGKGRMPAQPTLQGAELAALLHFILTTDAAASKPAPAGAGAGQESSQAAAGKMLFEQNCAFCHGRDAMGGETGPDLTQSKIVAADRNGDQIGQVVRMGRPDQKMPAFNFSDQDVHNLAAFVHFAVADASKHKGARRGVTIDDLKTGNAAEGKQYFAANCAQCHSATGDLAHVASQYQGLQLEQRMLYPRGAKSTVTVTLPDGQSVNGTLAYQDEFTIALRDSTGNYHSWLTSKVRYSVHSPVDGHVELFPKYTDADIHNLMAYLQTLR